MAASGRPEAIPNSFVTWRWDDAVTCSEEHAERSQGETQKAAVCDARGAGGVGCHRMRGIGVRSDQVDHRPDC